MIDLFYLSSPTSSQHIFASPYLLFLSNIFICTGHTFDTLRTLSSFPSLFHPPFLHLPLHFSCHSDTLYSPLFPFCFLLWLSFSVSHSLPPYSVSLLSVLPTSSALRSCSTGDSLLSSAFIRSAKSAPALAPPLPVLLHHHHPLLPPLADQLAGTHSLHYLSACLPLCLETCLYVFPKLKLNACCLVPILVFLAINLSLLKQQFACGSSGIIWPFPF